MKVSELYNHVAQLGFEDALESEERFYNATNRALLQVNTIRPAIKAYSINHTPLPNVLGNNTFQPIQHEGGTDVYFIAEGIKAFYFEVDGEGEVHIETWGEAVGWYDIAESEAFSENGTFKAHRGFVKADGEFIKGIVRLVFSGDAFYSIRNVALYKEVYSTSDENKIPAFEPYVRYDMRKLADDFLSFESAPIREGMPYEAMNQDYEIEGNTVLLPYGENGCYTVRYKRKPKKVDAGSYDADIDLDEDLCALLPCLVASYVLAEDEPNLAQYYLSLYREQVSILDARTKKVAPVRIKRESGW
jgi:hypothetical protein